MVSNNLNQNPSPLFDLALTYVSIPKLKAAALQLTLKSIVLFIDAFFSP